MVAFLKRQWFLTTLAILIAAGLAVGSRGESRLIDFWMTWFPPKGVTCCVVFLMAFSLDSARLTAAFRSPGPALLAIALNYGLVPLLAWGLMPLQTAADFRYGLMIAASVPCTLAAASVMTRKAGGNDAVSLLVTLVTNGLCFVLTPLWLYAATSTRVELDPAKLMQELLLTVLVPTVLGQALRQPKRARAFVDRHKAGFSVLAQVLIELTVTTAALRAGQTLRAASLGDDSGTAVTIGGALIVWACCIAVHLCGLGSGLFLARRLKFAPAECAPVAFAGSQKTLPIGLYIASDPALFGTAFPFALFPMLLYHVSQLFLDTLIAGRLAEKRT